MVSWRTFKRNPTNSWRYFLITNCFHFIERCVSCINLLSLTWSYTNSHYRALRVESKKLRLGCREKTIAELVNHQPVYWNWISSVDGQKFRQKQKQEYTKSGPFSLIRELTNQKLACRPDFFFVLKDRFSLENF